MSNVSPLRPSLRLAITDVSLEPVFSGESAQPSAISLSLRTWSDLTTGLHLWPDIRAGFLPRDIMYEPFDLSAPVRIPEVSRVSRRGLLSHALECCHCAVDLRALALLIALQGFSRTPLVTTGSNFALLSVGGRTAVVKLLQSYGPSWSLSELQQTHVSRAAIEEEDRIIHRPLPMLLK